MISQGIEIPKENGISLASVRNPWAEASKWADRITIIDQRTQVVLGLGAGLHILELARRTTEKIFVIDMRDFLIPNFNLLLSHETNFEKFKNQIEIKGMDHFLNENQNIKYQVQSFQPAWGPRMTEFSQWRDSLNLRSALTAKKLFRMNELKDGELVSLRSIDSNKNEVLALQELIL